MENILEQLLDLGQKIGNSDEVLDIILKSKSLDELYILKSGLNKMLERGVKCRNIKFM